MKARAAIAAALMCASFLGAVPARAGSASGVCLANITFTFSATITKSSSPTPLQDFSGSGICETTAQPGAEKTVVIVGSGPAGLESTCDVLQVDGSYGIGFSPSPAPSANNGTFTFFGNASGGEIEMTGTGPQLLIVGTLAGSGAIACATNGVRTLTFEAVLPFVDP
jgi:hypothetical protein